jgi:hypothetical protein
MWARSGDRLAATFRFLFGGGTMRSRHLFGILLSALAFVAVGSSGCGDDPSQTTTGSGGSGASTGTNTGGSGATGGGGGEPDTDGNTSCDTAEVITLVDPDVSSQLDPVATDRDYYKIDLKKGQAIYLGTTAKPETDPYDDTYPDTVITLYGPDGTTQIARNDDSASSNDSELLYIVPADGTYCLQVSECGAIFGAEVCAPPEGIVNVDYSVGGFELNPDAPIVSVDTEPNDAAAQATPMKTVTIENPPGTIVGYQSIGWGTYATATDKDYFDFTVAQNFTVDTGSRPLCVFDFYEPGMEGNGSTAESGVVANVALATAPGAPIAQVDIGVFDFTFGYAQLPSITMPCNKGQDYLFWMSRADGSASSSNDFYFFSHVQAGSNAVEKEPNDTNAQALEAVPTDDMTGRIAAITGDISQAGAGGDTDIFSIPVPAGMWLASAVCSAERNGSGLRGLQVSLLDGNDNFLMNGSGAEGSDHILYIDGARVPDGATEVKMKVVADTQAANVSSKYYYCTLLLGPQ